MLPVQLKTCRLKVRPFRKKPKWGMIRHDRSGFQAMVGADLSGQDLSAGDGQPQGDSNQTDIGQTFIGQAIPNSTSGVHFIGARLEGGTFANAFRGASLSRARARGPISPVPASAAPTPRR